MIKIKQNKPPRNRAATFSTATFFCNDPVKEKITLKPRSFKRQSMYFSVSIKYISLILIIIDTWAPIRIVAEIAR